LSAVWNRTAEKASTLAGELSVQAPATVDALGSNVDAVVTCVSADKDVLEVVRELAKTMKSGGLVLDCSTVGAETARQAAEILKPPALNSSTAP
jgi:3-hydroxyisobutyrate dehydrogenase